MPAHWISLLDENFVCAEEGHTLSVRVRRRHHPEEAKRAARALSLLQAGELSAARQALEGAAMAPGNWSTLRTLTDPERRPPLPRQPLSDEVIRTQPVEQFVLDSDQFLLCLRKARRGAAPGPSGMTSDRLFPLLSSEGDSEPFAQVGSLLANGNVPDNRHPGAPTRQAYSTQ